MKRVPLIATSAGALGLALGGAGCGSDDSDEDTAGAGATGTQETSAAAGGAGAPVEVIMQDTENKPQAVTVRKGGTITWKNEDPFDHTVTKQKGPGKDFDSGNVAGGDSYEQTFTTAGKIDYHCEIHPNQTGTITVK